MEPLQALQLWGPLILTALGGTFGGGIAVGIYRALGRVEGTIEPWARRLERHSQEIEQHQVALVRLSNLPDALERIRQDAATDRDKLATDLSAIRSQIDRSIADSASELSSRFESSIDGLSKLIEELGAKQLRRRSQPDNRGVGGK